MMDMINTSNKACQSSYQIPSTTQELDKVQLNLTTVKPENIMETQVAKMFNRNDNQKQEVTNYSNKWLRQIEPDAFY